VDALLLGVDLFAKFDVSGGLSTTLLVDKSRHGAAGG
jgi:hypothetical protein